MSDFTELGLSENAEIVFRSLIEMGGANANKLAKQTRLPRATCYSVVEDLVERGLVFRERKRKGSVYVPHSPEALVEMVEREREQFEKQWARQHRAAEKLAATLRPLFDAKTNELPELLVHEGEKAVLSMLSHRLPLWRASIAKYDFTWWGYQDPSLLERYPEWFMKVAKSHRAPEKVCLLSNISSTEKGLAGKVPRREMRLVPPEMSFSSTIWVLGDYVVTIMTRREPHFAFEIHNSVMAANLRTVFTMLWTRP